MVVWWDGSHQVQNICFAPGVSHPTKTRPRGADQCVGFSSLGMSEALDIHASSQYHQDANPSHCWQPRRLPRSPSTVLQHSNSARTTPGKRVEWTELPRTQGDIAYVKMSHAYAGRTFAREATFFIRTTAGWGQEEISCSRL